jgi:hypothetical protein
MGGAIAATSATIPKQCGNLTMAKPLLIFGMKRGALEYSELNQMPRLRAAAAPSPFGELQASGVMGDETPARWRGSLFRSPVTHHGSRSLGVHKR